MTYEDMQINIDLFIVDDLHLRERSTVSIVIKQLE